MSTLFYQKLGLSQSVSIMMSKIISDHECALNPIKIFFSKSTEHFSLRLQTFSNQLIEIKNFNTNIFLFFLLAFSEREKPRQNEASFAWICSFPV